MSAVAGIGRAAVAVLGGGVSGVAEPRRSGRPRLPRDENGKILEGIPLLRGFAQAPKTWKFDIADLESMGNWLYERLRAKHGHLNERTFPGWVRGWILSNDYFFSRSENAVGLFLRYNEPLNPVPAARELFVYKRADVPLEMEALYEGFESWCRHAGVRKVECGLDSDFPIADIKNVVLCLRSRTVFTGEIDYEDKS